MNVLYVYSKVEGWAPHVLPLIALIRLSRFLHLLTISFICASKVRPWSNVIPRNFSSFLYLTNSPLSHNLGVLLLML